MRRGPTFYPTRSSRSIATECSVKSGSIEQHRRAGFATVRDASADGESHSLTAGFLHVCCNELIHVFNKYRLKKLLELPPQLCKVVCRDEILQIM
jgi:hypothetical protein